jgi:hypothetical protein
MAAYRRAGSEPSPIIRRGRSRPIGWRLAHPSGGRALCVVGDYQGATGGTDTIPLKDGGLDEVFRLANAEASAGRDVLLEGYQLSGEHDRTIELAARQHSRGQALHVLCLDVPLSRCVQNVVRRRRAGHGARPAIERTARAGQEALVHAFLVLTEARLCCEWLEPAAALDRTLALLGLRQAFAEATTRPWSVESGSPKRLTLTCPWQRRGTAVSR